MVKRFDGYEVAIFPGLRVRRIRDGVEAEVFAMVIASGNWILKTDDDMKGEFTVAMLETEWEARGEEALLYG